MTPLPVIDPERITELELIERESGVPLIPDLVEIFLRDAPRRIAELDEAVARGSLADVRTLAHGLKGSCGALGAVSLAALLERAEALAEASDLAGLGSVAAGLTAELERVRAALAAITSRRPQ